MTEIGRLVRIGTHHTDKIPDLDSRPEEYFDFCYVFNSHPVDFGLASNHSTAAGRDLSEASSLLEHSDIAGGPSDGRRNLFKELDSSYISKADMRYYISQVCCYRDLDGMERTVPADASASYFSSFSMAVHHDAISQGNLLSDPRIAGIFDAIRRSLRFGSRLERRAQIELTRPPDQMSRSLVAEEDEGGVRPPLGERPLSPPLALLPDENGGRGQFTSAGASSLPAFYGLSEFLSMLDSEQSPSDVIKKILPGVNDDFQMTMLDFLFVMREVFTSALRKCGADLSEFLSDDQTKLFVKVRIPSPPRIQISLSGATARRGRSSSGKSH